MKGLGQWRRLRFARPKARSCARISPQIDAWVLAELSRRDLVPAIWLPDPTVRGERERARFRLHLVRHRVMLKNRIHATLMTFGKPCPVSRLFGLQGREMLARLELPEPWTENITTALRMIDDLGEEIGTIERDLRTLGADHPYVALLQSVPGVAWILGYTIASEIGDISRFSSPKQLVGYTGLCPRVIQSGEKDWRGPLAKNGPKYLRWALIEAAVPCGPAPGLRRALPTHQESARPPARGHGRPGRGGSQARRGHLAHAPDGFVLLSGKVPLNIWSHDDPG